MSTPDYKQFPEDIQLSTKTDHKQFGQMIYYFDTGSQKFERTKAADHEELMRKVDATLLRAMLQSYIGQVSKHIDKAEIIHDRAQLSLALLKDCYGALTKDCSKAELFLMWEPFSAGLLTTAGNAIVYALECLIPPDFASQQLKKLFRQLNYIAGHAITRYQHIVYSHCTNCTL